MRSLVALVSILTYTTAVYADGICPDEFGLEKYCEHYNEWKEDIVCPCRTMGCDFSVTSRKCSNSQGCGSRFGKCKNWNKATCLRPGVYYADGGVICKNRLQQGQCSISDVLVGKKAGLEVGEILFDSRDVTYVHESNFIDPGNIRTVKPHSEEMHNCKLDRISHPDKDLFINQTYGATEKRSPDLCLSYLLPGLRQVGTGLYEISLKFLESYLIQDSKIARSFTVKLGDITLVEEMNIAKHVQPCIPFETIALFQYKDDGGQERIVVPGHPSFKYGGEQLQLSFCYGHCYEPPGVGDFMFSAFYVARLDDTVTDLPETNTPIVMAPTTPQPVVTKPTTTTTAKPTTTTTAKPTTTTTAKPTTTTTVKPTTTTTVKPTTKKPGPKPIKGPGFCDKFNDKMEYSNTVCPCRQATCEYNVVFGDCKAMETCKEWFGHKVNWVGRTCLRPGAHYVDGGILCNSVESSGICTIDEVIIAVKAGLAEGKTVVDSRNVRHTHEIDFMDTDNLRRVDLESSQKCDFDKITHPDKQLFIGQVYGAPETRNTQGCLSYPIPVMTKVGQYELSLKFIESILKDDPRSRSFTVKLGNLVLIEELDIENYADGTCKPLEVIIPFRLRIASGALQFVVQGHFAEKYIPQDMKLTLCYGNCKVSPDIPDFILSAFYIAKISSTY